MSFMFSRTQDLCIYTVFQAKYVMFENGDCDKKLNYNERGKLGVLIELKKGTTVTTV